MFTRLLEAVYLQQKHKFVKRLLNNTKSNNKYPFYITDKSMLVRNNDEYMPPIN